MNIFKRRFTLDDFILEIMRVPTAKLQLAQLREWVAKLDLKDDLFKEHISFCCQDYQRKLLCRTPRFDMLILCWQPNQFSSIHHHGESLNVTRVYRGILTSRTFSNTFYTKATSPVQINEEYLHQDRLTTVDRYQIHQLANTSEENLVTFHVYARPLQQIQVYSANLERSESVSVRYALEEELV